MVAHMCKETGWTVEYVLSMPARRFYAMRLEFLRLEQRSKANFFYDLCDVAAISICNGDYYKEVKEYYREAALDPSERERNYRMRKKVFNSDDPNESRKAAMALRALMGGAMVMANG